MSRRVHDVVARGYNSGSGIVAEKNRRVAARLGERWSGRAGPLAVVDLGVGDGAMLAQLAARGLPLQMTGLDVSPEMLRLAASRAPVRLIEAPAQRALEVLPANGFDLVLAHFILAYVNRQSLLSQARGLLAPGGVLSLVSTTEEGGAPFYEGLERHFRSARHPLKRALAWAADRALAGSSVPKSFADLEADIATAGMVILRRETMRQRIAFNNAEEAYRFGIEEGWAANLLAVPGVPVRIAQAAVRWGVRQPAYPFVFTHVVEMLEIGCTNPHVQAPPSRQEMPIQELPPGREPLVDVSESRG
jgi:ubiquinone/menaquinone biosynthesis C-methylase UbiE